MTTVLISGASVSFGAGLPNQKENKNLFVNQLAHQLHGDNLEQIDNISVIGIDNKEIFLTTASNIINKKYEHVLVCWQGIPRINLNLGLETYQTTVSIVSPECSGHDINLVGGQRISGKKILEIRNYLLRFYNPHWEILELVQYINILVDLARSENIKLYFINYSMPWAHERYFDKIQFLVPSDLDGFTQSVLQYESRNDLETRQLYEMIHNQYQNLKGIQEQLWLNLYHPLIGMQIDCASTNDRHPGIASQQIFVDYLSPLLQKKSNENC